MMIERRAWTTSRLASFDFRGMGWVAFRTSDSEDDRDQHVYASRRKSKLIALLHDGYLGGKKCRKSCNSTLKIREGIKSW